LLNVHLRSFLFAAYHTCTLQLSCLFPAVLCMHAGCNLQDELFASFEQIMALADKRGEPYARWAAARQHWLMTAATAATASAHP
jgi:hypothetical protein